MLAILVAIGGLIVPNFASIGDDAPDQATRATLSQVAEAIVGPGGYVEVMRFAESDETPPRAVGESTGLPWPSPVEVDGGREDHPQLHFLFREPSDLPGYDPVNRIGWRAEWLSAVTATEYEIGTAANETSVTYNNSYGENGDLAPLDGWGNPVVIQLPDATTGTFEERVENVRLVSAGRDEVIDTPANQSTPDLAAKGDDVVLYLYRADPFPPDED
ncbi:MAG: hypothetical protein AAGH99_09270 [Planctomycetota bacterium]